MAEQPDGHPCGDPEPHGPHTWHPHGDPLDVEHCPGVPDPHQCAYDPREEYSQLLDRQSELLTGVVNALKGEPPELTTWSHHDAPELAAEMRERAERAEDALTACPQGQVGHCLCDCPTPAEVELERLRGELRRLIEHRNPVAPAAIEEALGDHG